MAHNGRALCSTGMLALPFHRCTKDKLSANVYSKRFSPACINTLLGAVKLCSTYFNKKQLPFSMAKK